jgi:hypothetical protein
MYEGFPFPANVNVNDPWKTSRRSSGVGWTARLKQAAEEFVFRVGRGFYARDKPCHLCGPLGRIVRRDFVYGLKSVCENQGFTNLVPQGRLNLSPVQIRFLS